MEMEKDKIVFKGSHPDSLYRVATDSDVVATKVTRTLRVLRWPVALIAVCIALGIFVYFLMPENLESSAKGNATSWEPILAGVGLHRQEMEKNESSMKEDGTDKIGTKTSEIDFYDIENNKNADLITVIDTITEINPIRKLPIPPVFPTHLTPEVQYGNERADTEKRTPKLLGDTLNDSTLKPHITQKPEKPLAIYFKEVNEEATTTTETITRAETINDLANYNQKQINKIKVQYPVKTHISAHNEFVAPPAKEYVVVPTAEDYIAQTEHKEPKNDFNSELSYPTEAQDFNDHPPAADDIHFTSGHSKLFGISIEDAQRLKSTTQSAIYHTRVSPTLPTWRDRDYSTTNKYPTNIYSDVQCRSTRLALCRGVLPYDLAGAAATVGDVDITSLMPQIDYLVATNCSDRVRHFICALLEPECSPPPYPQKLPCHNLCKAIVDSCDGHIPRELTAAFNCRQYSRENCVAAKSPCYPREMTCGDGSCVPRDWLCDGRNDCPDGEDEQKCFQCEESDFKCPSGGCILKRWQCDGYKDCPEGEDESEAICGPRHVQVPEDLNSEPGEESAGSAPAPAVRRPNRVTNGQRKHSTSPGHGDNESSKELLVTSDSNNGLAMRTFTPSPSRLSPYNHTSARPLTSSNRKPKKEEPTERIKSNANRTISNIKTSSNPKSILENESVEDVNMGDLGFLDEFEKEGKNRDQKQSQRSRQRLFGAPALRASAAKHQTLAESVEGAQSHHVNKANNNFDKVVDGAALSKKTSSAEAADSAQVAADETEKEDIPEINSTHIKKDDVPNGDFNTGKQGWGRAHTSPCPSGELRCVDGLCITLAQLCDGTIDCTDHADEDNCYT